MKNNLDMEWPPQTATESAAEPLELLVDTNLPGKAGEKRYALFYRLGFHLLFLFILASLPFFLLPVTLSSAYQEALLNHFLMSELLQTPLYLANVFYFIPKLLKTGRYQAYALVLLIGCSLSLCLAIYVTEIVFPITDMVNEFPSPTRGGIIFPMLMLLAIGTSFEMIMNWKDHLLRSEHIEQEKKLLEKEKLILELSYLKSQMNPHFLFNTLNNIHSLAELKSGKTGDAILMLSDLLRYMLYGSDQGSVPLAKEIECIENYMAIQRLRISKKEAVDIRLDIRGNSSGSRIEPLMLLPFVENAFKHGISYQQKSEVFIDLHVNNNILSFRVFNTKKQEAPLPDSAEENASGIGLNNIRRRLDLLYPSRHTLRIQNEKESFETILTLQL